MGRLSYRRIERAGTRKTKGLNRLIILDATVSIFHWKLRRRGHAVHDVRLTQSSSFRLAQRYKASYLCANRIESELAM
jgi:hypothetical protein